MRKFLNWFKNEESGQGMVEYALIVAFIAIIIFAVMGLFGGKIKALINGIDLDQPTETDIVDPS